MNHITCDNFFEQPVILENDTARLEPLEAAHFELLLPVAMNNDLWLFTINKVYSDADFKKYFETAMEEKRTHKSYPFAIYDKVNNRYAGSTRFANIDFKNKRLEIGWTWIHPSLHGLGFNKHCKFLLLSFGFEKLLLNRIELKTSSLNLRSQKAMLKIGAVKEGVFRKHSVNDDGSIRDTVFFSFINNEWPGIKNTIFKEFLNR